MEILNKYMPSDNVIPDSKYKFMKLLHSLCPNTTDHIKYYVCGNPKCSKFYGKTVLEVCPVCACVEFVMFVENPLDNTIKHLFEKRDLCSVIENYSQVKTKPGFISDIKDGSLYKRLPRTSQYDLTLLTNTDGVPMGNSSCNQIWPIFSQIVEVPPKLRRKYMILQGVWVGRFKPRMNSFLKPMVMKLRELGTVGIKWQHPKLAKVVESKVYSPLFSVDAPACYAMQNRVAYNAGNGCGPCEQTGETALVGKGHAHVFKYEHEPANLRTHDKMLRDAQTATSAAPVDGIAGATVLSLLPAIDISKAFCAEYQHSLLLGTVRRLTNLMLDSKNKYEPYFIRDFQPVIDKELKTFTPTTYITRLPRSLDQLGDWKSSEIRSWLLYYLLPVLGNLLPPRFVQHWILLIAAIYILLKEEIKEAEIKFADTLLKLYVSQTENLYGIAQMTYNHHQLLHYAESVRNWGPLQHTSTFSFENENGILKSLVHGSTNVAVEVVNSVHVLNTLHFLKSFINENNISTNIQLLGASSKVNLPNCVNQLIQNHYAGPYNIYIRAKVRGMIYASKFYERPTRRNNTLLQYSNKCYGKVIAFIKYEDGYVIAVVEKITLGRYLFKHNKCNFNIEHIREYVSHETYYCIDIDQIVQAVICLTDTIVCLPPNLVETNL
jgi:hypothetical protein